MRPHSSGDAALGANGQSSTSAGIRLLRALAEFEHLGHAGVAGEEGWHFPTANADVESHEVAMAKAMRTLLDQLSDSHQLLVHRFFLTAVHRGAVLNEHFSAHRVASPERQAAHQAEFDDLSQQLEEMIDQVATEGPTGGLTSSRLRAAAYLWSAAWWCHARRDVVGFVDSSQGKPEALRALGRRADSADSLSNRIYHEAVEADTAYRNHDSGRGVDTDTSFDFSGRRFPTSSPPSERWGLPPHSESHM